MDNYPEEPAEAAASVLDSTLFQKALLAAAYSDAGSESNPGPNEGNLNVELLGSELIRLGDVEVPLDEILDFGQLGALASKSEASSSLDAYAVSGLAGADGGVTLDGETEDFGKASVDVLSVARLLGVDGLTDQIVDQLLLEAGAGAAEVKAENGVILDQDGVGGLGQYRVADLDLFLHSPVIEDAASSIYDIGGSIDTAVENLINENLDDSALTGLFDAVPGVPTPSITVDSNMQENLFQSVVGEPITSANQLITIDLSTGQLEIHLDKLVDNPDETEGGLNELPPNFELIDDTTYPLIAETVHELMQEVTRILIGAIEDSLNSVTVNIAFYEEGPLGTLDVSWSLPLADAVNGNFPEVVDNSTGTMAPVATVLVNTINTLGPALAPILGPVYDLVISDEGDNIFELLINDLKTDSVTAPIRELLSPVFDVLAQVLSITINRQVTSEGVTQTSTAAAAAETSFELSALSIALLPANEVARINLGNAAVRIGGDGSGPGEIDPTLSVNPDSVAPGQSTVATGEGYTPDSTATVQLVDPEGNPVGDPIPVETDSEGGFSTPVTVPADAELGDYTVVGTDDTTGEAAEAPLAVVAGSDICAMDPTLTVEPSAGYPGDTVSVVGQGFPAGVPVTVQLRDAEGNPVGDPITVTPDEACGFITDLTIPEDAEPGDHTVEAEPEDGSEGAEAPLEVLDPNTNNPGECTDPTITAEPTVVQAGDEVQVTGTGFPAGVNVVVQLFDTEGNKIGEPVTVKVDEDCGFTTPITVPEGTEPGVIIVDAEPEDGSEGAQTPIVVTENTGGGDGRDLTARFEKPTVTQGEEQTFYASGFEPGEEVVGLINSTSFALQAQAADEDGNVQWTFTVDERLDVGRHQGLAVSTVAGDSAMATFDVVAAAAGVGDGDGDGDGAGAGDGPLASTGANVTALIAATVLLLGAGAVMIKRRREISQAFATAMGRFTDSRSA
ncbi:choice-of-anchor G family protein [Promicromonospora thailandica]|uniref:LPXTG-motif cell wall anchor domain-containing protein n=1 Tax=Promicromonospora thailandica TaxID=765201 RepID=A0A9X2JVT3_9MICO|nr:choice-of-anchor G family protein [Promicromonospora thailandica]MCP2264812.1 LPXTG-motif cell wall anchor domain-containing protein [Promicromonospora thailandica]